ncbi:MAG: signal peptidase I [Bdellovibrionota bacterium]
MEAISYKRNRWLAALLSFLSFGLGQIYNGQARRAGNILFFLFALAALTRSHFVIWGGEYMLALLLLSLVLLWLWSIADSFREASTERPKYRYNRWYYYLAYYFLMPASFALLAMVFRKVGTADYYRIPAMSMAPTVWDGDYITINKMAFRFHKPKAGDVAVFRFPKDQAISFIKRVVAVPGDEVKIIDKILYVNGKGMNIAFIEDPSVMESLGPKEESLKLRLFREDLNGTEHMLAYEAGTMVNSTYGPVTVPPGQYFVLGDNRDRSSDSRIWGFVPEENFVGKASFVYFSRDPQTGKLRSGRIGKKIN